MVVLLWPLVPRDRSCPLGISKVSDMRYRPIPAEFSDLSRLALGTLFLTGYWNYIALRIARHRCFYWVA